MFRFHWQPEKDAASKRIVMEVEGASRITEVLAWQPLTEWLDSLFRKLGKVRGSCGNLPHLAKFAIGVGVEGVGHYSGTKFTCCTVEFSSLWFLRFSKIVRLEFCAGMSFFSFLPHGGEGGWYPQRA